MIRLPENRTIIKRRLPSLKRRLRNDASVHKRYADVMQSQSIYKNRKRFSVFVANRLAEIETYSDVNASMCVPTKLNPADEV